MPSRSSFSTRLAVTRSTFLARYSEPGLRRQMLEQLGLGDVEHLVELCSAFGGSTT